MDETRTGSKAAPTAGDGGRHPGSKRLVAYRRGTLPAAEREQVQEHLSSCPRCTRLLLELRDFEAAAREEPGPDPQRQEAWEALVRRLPAETAPGRPAAPLPEAPPRRGLSWIPLAAAALLLAAVGFSLWSTVTVREERRRLARLERQLQERDAALAALQGSLDEARRQLAERGSGQDLEKERLEKRVAELTATLAELRRAAKVQDYGRTPPVPAPKLEIAPRFALRGHPAPATGWLRAGGVVNLVQAPEPGGRLTLAFRLDDHPAYDEYLIHLLDGNGSILWGGRRRAVDFLGDAGTSVTLSRLAPRRYRLRIEGQLPEKDDLLGEYILEVEPR